MRLLAESDNSTDECTFALLWRQSTLNSQQPLLYVCIIATFTHSLFWLQFIFFSSIRQKSMQWIYAYLVTDILLVIRFFFLFIIHTLVIGCQPSEGWYLFICYFEATLDNYLNTLEVYILLALNICRHAQIARNKNVYETNTGLLTVAHLAIYILPLVNLLGQILLNWAKLDAHSSDICDLRFSATSVQIYNVTVAFVLPISLNVFVIYRSAHYIQLTSHLRRGQHHISARDKYHRSLVIQFLVFYIIWLLLWAPNIIVFQLQSKNVQIISICQLLNFIEITIDPMIIAGLDKRFYRVWKDIWKCLKDTFSLRMNPNLRQIAPYAS
ncbi:unnamed protein product [Adineta ricciae]|uniref:G-protein coupled receptors family 1 profile domain-containing protein n=1 Tax=Adineta ricciae TaxID=249248 RepID=A0A814HR27_ADIRI|nr:unnamed protein product [Adineta ricciae]CAF1172585.1 unnamed protein product [Adineta ricciae]